MSTSFLYHSSRIQGVKYRRTTYEPGRIIFDVEPKHHLLVCVKCSSDKIIRNGEQERTIRSLKMGRKTTFVRFFQPRLRCKSCGASRMMKIPFANKWSSYTKAVEREVIDLSRSMTLQDVSRYLGLDWRAVKEIQKKSGSTAKTVHAYPTSLNFAS